jgi:hypothetical protein
VKLASQSLTVFVSFLLVRVPLFVNSLYSDHTLLTKDYETHAGYCFALNATTPKLNLGQKLQGDRFLEAPFEIEMLKNVYCKQLCVANLDEGNLHQLISQFYAVRWMLLADFLPGAFISENDWMITTRYWGGSTLGYLQKEMTLTSGTAI